MGWTQLRYRVAAADAEALAALLEHRGALSVTLADAGDEPQYQAEPGAAPLWSETWVTGLYPEGLEPEALARDIAAAWSGTLSRPDVETLPDQQWELTWKDGFEAMQFGQRLWVVPHWLEPPEPEAVNLRLDPGLAFGTGTHPTTALCLEWLEARDLSGRGVLDYGCGSGILAIAAGLLGAGPVWASDIDPQALAATRDNAAENGVGERLQVLDVDAAATVTAEVVVANILAGPLVELAPTLAGRVAAGGTLVLSGLLEDQAAAVTEAYAPWLVPGAHRTRDGWALVELHRREAVP